MKILMMTDIEGVAGVVSFTQQAYADGKYYDDAKRLLTAEINAAVDGMLEVGVTDVLVFDGHGAGGVHFDDLHSAAKLLHGRPTAPRSVWAPIAAEYDACMILGQHAMAGARTGNLNHTQSSLAIDYYKLNGKPIGEIAQFALHQGAFGQPMICLTGDEDACAETRELIPGITTVSVKRGLGRNCAISVSPAEARRRIREGVTLAIQTHQKQPIPPLQWPGPYELEIRYFHTDSADGAASTPGAERVDSQTVRFRGDDVREIVYR